jgi:integrase
MRVIPALALRISYGGRRSWVWFYRKDGKQRRLTLGAWPAMGLAESREAWRTARERLKKGLEPVPATVIAADAADADVLHKVVADWLARDQATNRKYRTPARGYGEVKRILYREVVPLWGNMRIGDITREMVRELIKGISDRGKVTQACRVYARLHRLFTWSVGQGTIKENPMLNMDKPGADMKRKRVLDDEELRVAWAAMREVGWPMGAALQLLLLTAARRKEVGALRWSEIDADEIHLDGDRTKNGEPHHIPLSGLAREIINAVPRVAGSPYAFSTTGTTPVSGWSKVKARVDDAMRAELGENFKPWRLHDLRRTAATGLERLKVPLQVTEALLGHTAGSKAGVAGIYQTHDYREEKREAVEKWAGHIASLGGGVQ